MTHDDEFDTFFRQRYTDLVVFLMRLGARLDDAEEAAQEAMIAAYASWPRIHDPKAWTWRVASRIYLRQVRRRRLRELLVPDDALAQRASHYQQAEPSTTEADLVWRDRFRRLLLRLTERQQRVFAMWYDGYLGKEIADRLNVTPGTIRSLLRNARHRLAEILDHPRRGR